ncbi:hypothetical protein BDQ12DRAFT_359513 [Crucibulum laeve]|uniref:Uncharacterized protein n=1 Tax=Crucibulum laeve TaxID=68775 RepID=A0A5C3LQM3_9AGAR|nr:hypothetical protein BDQ12DRAFT_359513 [Crucibulum laeve]
MYASSSTPRIYALLIYFHTANTDITPLVETLDQRKGSYTGPLVDFGFHFIVYLRMSLLSAQNRAPDPASGTNSTPLISNLYQEMSMH